MNFNYNSISKYKTEYNNKTKLGCVYIRLNSTESIIDMDYNINFVLKDKRIFFYKTDGFYINHIGMFVPNINKS